MGSRPSITPVTAPLCTLGLCLGQLLVTLRLLLGPRPNPCKRPLMLVRIVRQRPTMSRRPAGAFRLRALHPRAHAVLPTGKLEALLVQDQEMRVAASGHFWAHFLPSTNSEVAQPQSTLKFFGGDQPMASPGCAATAFALPLCHHHPPHAVVGPGVGQGSRACAHVATQCTHPTPKLARATFESLWSTRR